MKKNQTQVILLITVLALTTAFLYIYLSVSRALQKTPKPILTPQETRVLDPKLDEKLLDELEQRRMR
ncbi:hypothetical protein COS54_01905 [Candidatus Shapirobacteria bacterium CG03_land_8_20_14_0_80_39_12]|uniref:Uncharacterized protein n=1 Tax=Candidatus Shapirobacteria bacterium CG03_land_8_20_14_0_80_39_12 TaxID=1974879 RepID=A0A2M7BD23_9BACT|nr:MAG: hypothetical protein COS54_01905 [Candidatus Shapirobacteria bacterium CG03_land_8_20_14_0_80_39_12]